jgi:hypothetical protein
MVKIGRIGAVLILCAVALLGCQPAEVPVQAYVVYYTSPSGGGLTTGSVYPTGATVYIPGAGNLAKPGFVLAGWNTMADGSGISYTDGSTFIMGSSDITLYAVWIPDNLQFAASGTSINITLCGSAPSPSLTIPGGVTGIASEAFFNVLGLTSVDIPASVSNIGFNAFYGCANLAGVTVLAASPPALPTGSQAFAGCAPALRIAVPASSVGAYQAAPGWSAYAAQIVSM